VVWSLTAACVSVEPGPQPKLSLEDDDEEEQAAPAAPMRPPRPLSDDGQFYMWGDSPSKPYVRYLDGQMSRNESCPILRGNKLSRKVPPIYINGAPIGFC
jgi:hypothetical protein